jgi:hypothetical protein
MDINGRGVSQGTRQEDAFRRVVMKEEIETLSTCSEENGLDAFYLAQPIGNVYRHTMPYEDFKHVWPTPKIEPDFDVETDGTKQEIDPFTPKELEYFGITLEQEKDEEEELEHRPSPKRKVNLRTQPIH